MRDFSTAIYEFSFLAQYYYFFFSWFSFLNMKGITLVSLQVTSCYASGCPGIFPHMENPTSEPRGNVAMGNVDDM